jgi:GH24 family phage-related lysozyme (muramidase)
MSADILSLFPWVVVSIVFTGMLALCWRAMSALDTQAKVLAQIISEFQRTGGVVASTPAPAPTAPHPAPAPAPAPATSPVVDPGLVAFVKKQEGFSTKAYWDYKQYSIGYGTKANSPTEVIDEAEATRRLTTEINIAEQAVEKVAANAPKGVKQALTDLTYNAGAGWETQELGALIKAGNYIEAKAHLLQYNHAGGQVLAGLTARREAEASWFDSPL